MEENKNSENKVAEEAKKLAKDATKNLAKKAGKKLWVWAAPAIGWCTLILLAVGVVNLVVFEVKAFFTGKTMNSSANSTNADQIKSLVSTNSNGGYVLNENYAEQIIEEMEAGAIDTKEMGFITKNGDNMIDKYIKVEMQTMLPKTSKSGDFDGIIKIQRASADTGEIKSLTYKKYDDFCKIKDNTILDYFSINPDTFKLCIATNEYTVYKDFDGQEITSMSTNSSIIIQEIEYQTSIQNYAAPLNFLLSLHVIAQDVDFMDKVVDTILENDDPIILTYVETAIIQTTQKDYTGTKTITTTTTIERDEPDTLDDPTTEEDEYDENITVAGPTTTINSTDTIDNTKIKEYLNHEEINLDYYQEIKTTNTGYLCITKADTWLKKSLKEIQQLQSPDTGFKEDSSNDLMKNKIVVIDNSIDIKTEGQEPDITTITTTTTQKEDISITETILTNGKNKRCIVVDKESEIKIDNLVQLIEKYPKVKNNITTAPSNLLYLLQQNENTQKLEQIMRYVIYKLSGINYGVTDADLERLFVDSEYIYASTSELLKQNIRYWEYFSLPQTNADRTKYIIREDGSGNLVIGYGVDVNKYKDLFDSKGYSTAIGTEIDIEFVDSIEELDIEERKSVVEDATAGLDLTIAQINALVLRTYDFEDPADAVNAEFVDAYTTYWDKERDDKSKEKTKEADFTHELYVEYMSQPNKSSNGKSLETKRESEWILFQTGYYNALNTWNPSYDSLLEAADTVHQAQITWTYSIGGDLYWNNIEKSLNNPNRVTCCATFVSSAIYVAGYFTEEEMNSFNYNSASALYAFLKNEGWKVISSYDELAPGDVVFTSNNGPLGHVQLYVGDDTWYNAGSTYAIQVASPYNQGSWPRTHFQVALRQN